MKNVWLPDANAILCYLLRDIPARTDETDEFFDRVCSGENRAVMLEGVLAECVFILEKHYRVPRGEIGTTLSDLLRYKGFVNRDRDDLLAALETFGESKLDFVDCILVARARAGGHKVFTFDRKLAKLLEKT